MVVPLIAYLLAIGASVAVGYTLDRLFGDGHYTAKEFTIDVAMGAAGLGIVKALSHGAKSVRYYRLARRASLADDTVLLSKYASAGTLEGMTSAVHVGIVQGASAYDSHIYDNPDIIVGVGVGATDDIQVGPDTIVAVVTSKQSNAVFTPIKRRCEQMFKGKRCRRLLGHAGRHRYG